ncbi:MAG: ImmA/IrrE family metallo-endopeptidase [Rhodobacteraceae bacterium]|nr:ImmA/IrrE family metallo-endopeptidase [Paracoccaceae bacterium]
MLGRKIQNTNCSIFFPEPPEAPSIEESFRTIGGTQYKKLPSKIKLLLRRAHAFQLGLEELNFGRNPSEKLVTHDLGNLTKGNYIEWAEKIRQYLAVSIEQQFEWESTERALKEWRKVFFDAGIFVFKDTFRCEGFDGFCLYHKEFPIIYINNSSTRARQIFTLFHELAHLLYRTSGVNTQDIDYFDFTTDNREIEVDCNQLAAEILVPESDFNQAFNGRTPQKKSQLNWLLNSVLVEK